MLSSAPDPICASEIVVLLPQDGAIPEAVAVSYEPMQRTFVFVMGDLPNLSHWAAFLLQDVMQLNGLTIIPNGCVAVYHTLEVRPLRPGVVVIKINITPLVDPATYVAYLAVHVHGPS